jgi:C4-dicarboxylate transporter DctQ subunit
MWRISNKLKHIEEISLFVLVIVTLAIIFANVVLRYGFDKTLTWGEELSRFLFVAITYIGASAGVRKKGHIIVDLITVLLPKSKRALALTSNILAALFCVLIFISSIKYAHFLKSVDQTSTGLEVPMWIPYLGVILGSLMMCFRFTEAFLQISKRQE